MIDVHARDVKKKKIEDHDIHELAAPDGKDRPDVFVCFFKEEGKKNGTCPFFASQDHKPNTFIYT
jgi:hypothetical protein